MFIQESLNQYPELVAFLNANTESQRIACRALLKESYKIKFTHLKKTCSPVQITAALGKLDHLNSLLEESNFNPDQLILANNYALRLAAKNGHLAIVNRLLDIELVKNYLNKNDDSALVKAAKHGHLAVVNCLLERTVIQQQVAVDALCSAAEGGSLEVVNRLLAFDVIKSKTATQNNKILRRAISNGHHAVVNRLLELDIVRNKIAAENNDVLRIAAQKGDLDLVNYLLEFDGVRKQLLNPNRVLQCAAAGGNLNLVNRLLEFDFIKNQVAINNNEALCLAASGGHLDVVNRLLAFDTVSEKVDAEENEALDEAACNGHLDVVNRLLAFDAVRDQVAVEENKALRGAAINLHLNVVKRLLDFDAVKENIDLNQNIILRAACKRPAIIALLLPLPQVFAYVEMHEHEFGQYTHPYLEKKLCALRIARHLQELRNPEGLFDLNSPEEVELLFYMARNLIRRNDPALLDDLRFLLEIPALKNLAATEVRSGQSNALIRLALRIGNQGAAEILLNIPAVHELTVANHYYQDEVDGKLNLRELARDRESSMHVLSTKEQERLSSAIQHYQAQIQQAGGQHLFQALKAQLKDRYEKNPACIKVDGNILNLPLSFEAFQQLKLIKPFYSEALKAYYQNKDHTALRYLSKPNPWMHPNASYVYVNPEQRTQRWSTFEDYMPLILMFWLAAIDNNIAPTEGQTLEGRLNHFIDELALIGRAHNWDKSRIKANSNVDLGMEQREEYDDLEGDRPSCYSGVKRRLFQSVIGHPLLQMLTMDIVKQELQDFVRNHFQHCILKDTQGVLKQAYKTYLIELEVRPTLQQFDIKPEAQNDFIANLQKKYGQQFDSDPSFIKYIHARFQLKTTKQGEVNDAHVLNFAAEANIEQLFRSKTLEKDEIGQMQVIDKSSQAYAANLEKSGYSFFSQGSTEDLASSMLGEKKMTMK